MKLFLKNNWFIIIPYFLIVLMSLYYLFNYDKVLIHLNINKITGNLFFDLFFKYLTHAGDGIVALIIIAITLLLNARNGIYLLAAYVTSGLTSSVLKKYIFDVDRPHFVFHEYLYHYKIHYIDGVEMLGMRSFPSGHATSSFAIFLSLALVSQNKFLKFSFFTIALLAAFSRTYLSQHWLVDITAGSILGTLAAFVFYYVFIASNKLQKLNKPILKVFNP